MNIVLVIFDSLRKDCIGALGAPPWGKVITPYFDKLVEESLLMDRAYPEALPTLPTRRAIYTGRRVYPSRPDVNCFLKGDICGGPGWGPIPEDQATLAEMLNETGFRTALISDLYHQFRPGKNYWRGFDQWVFIRGQESDPARSGPKLTPEQLDAWVPRKLQKRFGDAFNQHCFMNMHDRVREEDYFAPRVFQEASTWLKQNQDAEKFFLTVEAFDPHAPMLVPAHYRRMYSKEEGQEQVAGVWDNIEDTEENRALVRRSQANYSGLVSLCDRWFGHFMETMRATGRLDDTMVIMTSDHGHSVGDRDYINKHGYPSYPEVYDIPIIIRFPKAEHAGTKSDMFVQHHDISAEILKQAGVKPPAPIDGIPFIKNALAGKPGKRDHVTVGWGSSPTVITDKWWFNCKIDGSGVLLYDLKTGKPFDTNIAGQHQDVVNELWAVAKKDAGGSFPEHLIAFAGKQADAPASTGVRVDAP